MTASPLRRANSPLSALTPAISPEPHSLDCARHPYPLSRSLHHRNNAATASRQSRAQGGNSHTRREARCAQAAAKSSGEAHGKTNQDCQRSPQQL